MVRFGQMKKRKAFASLALIFVCWAAVAAGRQLLLFERRPKLETRNLERAKGNPRADVWVVEYFDYQCPSCGQVAPVTNSYLLTYPSRFYFQARFYPLIEHHRYALKSAIYAECVSHQHRFWPFHDLLFEEQNRWPEAPDVDDALRELARRAGVDSKSLDACVGDPKTKEAVLKEKETANRLGVDGTPTFFVNGKMAIGTEALKRSLDEYVQKGTERR